MRFENLRQDVRFGVRLESWTQHGGYYAYAELKAYRSSGAFSDLVAGISAAVVPTIRAARVQPAVALRHE